MVETYWEVREDTGTGSGVMVKIKGDTLLLTAAHVVGKSKSVKLRKEVDGGEVREREGVVVKVGDPDKGPDLALVAPKGDTSKIATAIFDGKPSLRRGEETWYVGSPAGIHGVIEKSIVNKVHTDGRGWDHFMTGGLGWYGNSGGPVFVTRGGKPVLVGVVTLLSWGGGKAPVLCETPETIDAFFAAYNAETVKASAK